MYPSDITQNCRGSAAAAVVFWKTRRVEVNRTTDNSHPVFGGWLYQKVAYVDYTTNSRLDEKSSPASVPPLGIATSK